MIPKQLGIIFASETSSIESGEICYPYDFLLTPANIDDRTPVIELIEGHDRLLKYFLAEKCYTGVDFRNKVKSKTGVSLLPLPKSQTIQPKELKNFRQLVFKKCRRIEATGSQLVDQLNLQSVRAKSLWRLMTCLFSKFLTFDVAYLINLLNGIKCPIKIKHLIF